MNPPNFHIDIFFLKLQFKVRKGRLPLHLLQQGHLEASRDVAAISMINLIKHFYYHFGCVIYTKIDIHISRDGFKKHQ